MCIVIQGHVVNVRSQRKPGPFELVQHFTILLPYCMQPLEKKLVILFV